MDTLTASSGIVKSKKNDREAKIFIVDDDPAYRHAIEYRLRQQPEYKVYSFKTGEECLKHVELLDPDIVILDYCLNEMDPQARNGLDVLKRLKILKPEISILMLSGKENLEVATNSIRYGAFDYIVKNEGAFVRLQNLINKILNKINIEKWSRKQGNHIKILAVITPIAVVAPALSKLFLPEIAVEITIGLLVFLILFFIITQKSEGDEWTKLSENMRSDN